MVTVWILLAQAQAVAESNATAAWVTVGGIGVITTAFGSMLTWLLRVHLPEKEKQIKELLATAAAEREESAKTRENIFKSAEAERERERQARHQLGNKFQEAVKNMLDKHEMDAEKDRAAFMQRAAAADAAFRERSQDMKDSYVQQGAMLKEAIQQQTVAFEKALDRVALAMADVCEASAYANRLATSSRRMQVPEPKHASKPDEMNKP